jgi:hypothetical protein
VLWVHLVTQEHPEMLDQLVTLVSVVQQVHLEVLV